MCIRDRPMMVADLDMARFIRAVRGSENPKYYLPEEISDTMSVSYTHLDVYKRQIRLKGCVRFPK